MAGGPPVATTAGCRPYITDGPADPTGRDGTWFGRPSGQRSKVVLEVTIVATFEQGWFIFDLSHLRVGLDPDKPCAAVGCGHVGFGEQAADCAGLTGIGEPLIDDSLPGVILGDGKGING